MPFVDNALLHAEVRRVVGHAVPDIRSSLLEKDIRCLNAIIIFSRGYE
jgi:hypothetical protein